MIGEFSTLSLSFLSYYEPFLITMNHSCHMINHYQQSSSRKIHQSVNHYELIFPLYVIVVSCNRATPSHHPLSLDFDFPIFSTEQTIQLWGFPLEATKAWLPAPTGLQLWLLCPAWGIFEGRAAFGGQRERRGVTGDDGGGTGPGDGNVVEICAFFGAS